MNDTSVYIQRLQERLPRVMRGGPGTKLHNLLDVIGGEMVQMAQGATWLMRSRWIGLARGWSNPEDDLEQKHQTDLASIGRLLGCLPRAMESTLQFRRRLLEFVAIHREGLGTARSLLRLVALVCGAEHPPKITVEEDLILAEFEVRGEDGLENKLRLELLDNPPHDNRIHLPDVESQSGVDIENQGIHAVFPQIDIKATEKDVAVPMLFNRQTGQMVMYVGQVPKGSRLTLEEGAPPKLDGVPREEFLQTYARFDQDYFRPQSSDVGARFALSDMDAEDKVLFGYAFQFDRARFYSPDAEYPTVFAEFDEKQKFPQLPPGESSWEYTTLQPDQPDHYLKDLQNREIIRCHALKQPAPKVALTFSWRERLAACFSLRIIPNDYKPPFMQDRKELEQAVRRALTYGKAAGVQFIIADEPK